MASTIVFETDVAAQQVIVSTSTLTANAGVTITADTFTIGDSDANAGTVTTMTLDPTAVLDVTDFVISGSFGYYGDLSLNVTNMTLDSDSVISANGKGYAAAQGPGVGTLDGEYGGGGGHGGIGGTQYNAVGGPRYGSALQPLTEGSGGNGAGASYGGLGGGALHLVVTNTLIVNGTLSANGGAGYSRGGGGAGGSILIETGTFAGAGTITANGGNGGDYYGIRAGGAGGRIAVYCNNNSFGGTLSVAGGTTGGQNGTVAVFDNTNPEDLNFDVGHSWRFEPGDGPFVYNDMTMTGTEGNVSAIGIEADLTAQTINTEYATLTVSEGVVLTVDTLNIGNGTTISVPLQC